MHFLGLTAVAFAALTSAASSTASSTASATGAVASDVSPPSSPPPGCSEDYNGSFQIGPINITSTTTKRSLALNDRDTPLTISLSGGVLMDSVGRTGYIASNYQFQFDDPPQAGAIWTGGFSVCPNASLALGSDIFWYKCLSGTFYNLYSKNQGGQCIESYIQAYPYDGGSPGSANSTTTASSSASSTTSVVSTSSASGNTTTTALKTTTAKNGTMITSATVVKTKTPKNTHTHVVTSKAKSTASSAATTSASSTSAAGAGRGASGAGEAVLGLVGALAFAMM